MPYTFDYWRPAVTVDIVVFKVEDLPDNPAHKVSVLLIKRGDEPFKGCWALPGGFIDQTDATLLDAAQRELKEETGLEMSLNQIEATGNATRDPRGWTMTVVYAGQIKDGDPRLDSIVAQDDAVGYQWFNIDELPSMAFDHEGAVMHTLSMVVSNNVFGE